MLDSYCSGSTQKGDSCFGNTRNVHRQNNNPISQKSICRSSRVIKTYLTISDKFFIPNLIHYLRSYIKGCHICQLSRNEKPPTRHFQTRINPNYIPMSRLSMDLKVMPKSQEGHRYILCVIDEVTNFLIMVAIFQARSEEVGEALLEHVITKHCIPDYIIMDQDSAFMSSLMTYLFHRLNIKIKTIAPYNHHWLQGRACINPYMHSN